VRIEMLRFAVDTAIITKDEIHLKRALESLDDIQKKKKLTYLLHGAESFLRS